MEALTGQMPTPPKQSLRNNNPIIDKRQVQAGLGQEVVPNSSSAFAHRITAF